MQYNVGVLWLVDKCVWLVNKLGNNILFMGRLRLSAVWLNDGANFLASGPYIWETQKLQWMFRKLVVIMENIGQGFAKEMFLTNAGWQCSVTNFALGTPGTHWELHTSQVATVIFYRTCKQSRTEVIQIHWWVTTAFALHSCLVFFLQCGSKMMCIVLVQCHHYNACMINVLIKWKCCFWHISSKTKFFSYMYCYMTVQVLRKPVADNMRAMLKCLYVQVWSTDTWKQMHDHAAFSEIPWL